MFTSSKEAIQFISSNKIESVDFKACDIKGRWRHITIPGESVSERLFEKGLGCDGSNYGFKGVSKSDMILKPVLQSAFLDPFCDLPTLSFICEFYEADDNETPFSGDPRLILKKASRYFLSLGISDKLLLGPEYEFYVFRQVSFKDGPFNSFVYITPEGAEALDGYEPGLKDAYQADQPADKFASFRQGLSKELIRMGIKLKYHHHEAGGPGQLEIETEFGEPLEMADNSMKIKYAVKNYAKRRSLTATFMPKPIYGAPGNGFHVHFKAFDGGKPIFNDSSGYAGLSQTAIKFITGLLRHSGALSAFCNPSVNSYKRLTGGYEAPIAAVFSLGNRSAAVRIPAYAKTPEEKRFEYRASDFSGNPYLVFASLIMAGCDGILKASSDRERFGPSEGNLFDFENLEENGVKLLPADLLQAAEALEADNLFLREGEVFPENILTDHIKAKKKEAIILKPQAADYEYYYDC